MRKSGSMEKSDWAVWPYPRFTTNHFHRPWPLPVVRVQPHKAETGVSCRGGAGASALLRLMIIIMRPLATSAESRLGSVARRFCPDLPG
jgi:hypothetical protein